MRIATLALCLGLAAAVAASAQGSSTDGSFHRRFAVSGAVQLDVSTGSGAIQVTGAPGSAVVVDATIHQNMGWFGGGDPAAIQAVENNPPVQQSGNHIWLRQPDHGWFNSLTISYVVTTPPDTTLNAEAGSGRITVSGLRGSADVSAGSGTINLRDLGGDLRAHTGSGEIRFGRVGGNARLEAGSGDIDGDAVAGRLSASTGSGTIQVDRVDGGADVSTGSGGLEIHQASGDITARAASGDIRIGGVLAANHHWDLSASSGGVRVTLPPDTRAQVRLHASSGGIHVRSPSQRNSDDSERRTWEGTLGPGGASPAALLTVRTSSGSIVVN